MNAIEILINYSKLETVQNLVDNIDLVTDIIKGTSNNQLSRTLF